MNPIHKSLTISSLAYSIFFSWLSVYVVGTQWKVVYRLLLTELAKETADRFREAAEIGDVTRIKTIAEKFRSKSEAFAPIADRFIQMAEVFDFDGISKLADETDKSQSTG